MSCNYVFSYSTSFSFIDGGLTTRCGWQGDSNDGEFQILSGTSEIPYLFNKDLAINLGEIKGAIISYDYFEGAYIRDEEGYRLECNNIMMLMCQEAFHNGSYSPNKIGQLLRRGENPLITLED